MTTKRSTIIEALQNWKRPPAPEKSHRALDLLKAALPEFKMPVSRWTRFYTDREMLDRLELAVEGVLRVLPGLSKKHALDPRLKQEIGVRETVAARFGELQPILSELGRVVAVGLRERLGAANAFQGKMLALSDGPEVPAENRIISALEAVEIRRHTREIAAKDGASAVAEFIKQALADGRFDVVASVESAYPKVIDDISGLRLSWARAEFPDALRVEQDLSQAVHDAGELATFITGTLDVLSGRAVVDGLPNMMERKCPPFERHAELNAAVADSMTLAKAGKVSIEREEHAAGLQALANAGKPQ